MSQLAKISHRSNLPQILPLRSGRPRCPHVSVHPAAPDVALVGAAVSLVVGRGRQGEEWLCLGRIGRPVEAPLCGECLRIAWVDLAVVGLEEAHRPALWGEADIARLEVIVLALGVEGGKVVAVGVDLGSGHVLGGGLQLFGDGLGAALQHIQDQLFVGHTSFTPSRMAAAMDASVVCGLMYVPLYAPLLLSFIAKNLPFP